MAEFLSKYQCKNPVVLIVFNRPEKTVVLLERLKQVTPGKIYVISDGPRENRKDDFQLVEQVRSLIDEKIDWDCDLTKIYSPKNLSGPIRVPSGFDEVFVTEKQAIILEDDCIPSVSFFRFCDELLDKYSVDQRIGTICGFNLEFDLLGKPVENRHPSSYFYSIYPASWGWATWKRVWENFDHDLKEYPKLVDQGFFNAIFRSKNVLRFWLNKFDKFYRQEKNNWDYKLTYSLLKNKQLSVIPNCNLVQNIGTDGGANYKKKDYVAGKKAQEIYFPLSGPDEVEPDKKYDHRVSNHFFSSSKVSKLMRLLRNKIIQVRG